MTLHDRIKKVVEYSKLNTSQFAKFVGFKTPQTVRSLLSGATKTLSYEVEQKLTKAFPEINRAWLVTGEGEMLKAANIAIDHSVAGNNNNVTMQTPGLIGKALDEIAAQRKLVERLVTMLEKVVEQLTSREEYNS